jgi:hypothetical protein
MQPIFASIHPKSGQNGQSLGERAAGPAFRREVGGPTRIRTWNQGIRDPRKFPPGADYLFTHSHRLGGCGTL